MTTWQTPPEPGPHVTADKGQPTLSITADQADEILDLSYGRPGETAGDLTYVTTIESDQRRWMQGITIVVSDPHGAFWGLDYDRGLTEDQGNEYPWRGYGDRTDATLTRLYPHTTTKIAYRTKPPAADVTDTQAAEISQLREQVKGLHARIEPMENVVQAAGHWRAGDLPADVAVKALQRAVDEYTEAVAR